MIKKIAWLGPYQPESRMLASTSPSPAARRWTADLLETLTLAGLSVTHIGHEQAQLWPFGPMTSSPGVPTRVASLSRVKSVPYWNLPWIRCGSLSRGYAYAVRELIRHERFDAVLTYNAEPYHSEAVACLTAIGVPWFPILLDWRHPSAWPHVFGAVTQGSRGIVFASAWAFSDYPGQCHHLFNGGIHEEFLDDTGDPEHPIVLYTGTKAPEGGLDLLLDAWPHVRSRGAQLHICGQGSHARLAGVTRRDATVQDHGLVSEAKLRELMSAAAVLVNPRDPAHPDNRFNFPSKILHYLGSGKPIVSTWTAGLSPDYRPLLHVADPPNANGLAAAVDRAIRTSPEERQSHREQVSKFIHGGAGWLQRTKALLAWCESLIADTKNVDPLRLAQSDSSN
jgi:glycosyltransferase involved in cell wall biosynthesis